MKSNDSVLVGSLKQSKMAFVGALIGVLINIVTMILLGKAFLINFMSIAFCIGCGVAGWLYIYIGEKKSRKSREWRYK